MELSVVPKLITVGTGEKIVCPQISARGTIFLCDVMCNLSRWVRKSKRFDMVPDMIATSADVAFFDK